MPRNGSMNQTHLTLLIEPVEEGGFIAECPELPGCMSQGETAQEAEANLRLAMDACLSVRFEDFLLSLRSSEVPEPRRAGTVTTACLESPRLTKAA